MLLLVLLMVLGLVLILLLVPGPMRMLLLLLTLLVFCFDVLDGVRRLHLHIYVSLERSVPKHRSAECTSAKAGFVSLPQLFSSTVGSPAGNPTHLSPLGAPPLYTSIEH